MEKIITKRDKNVYAEMGKSRCYMDTKLRCTEDDLLFEYIRELQDFIKQDGYPCVGARTAVNSKSLSVGIFKRMSDSDTPKELAFGLIKYLNTLKQKPSNYLTFVAIFPFSQFVGEKQFETALWELLNDLHELDKEHFQWSREVSNDPLDPQFSFSFGEKGFFIVGMHPNSSRKARRFRYPAIAFNLHDQFENLRIKGRYEVMKKAIREADLNFDGAINPMLDDFGKGLEAPQYSGRTVDKNWKCPFNKQQ